MNRILIFILSVFACKAQAQINDQDSIVGYVQPWLSERGQIVWMNTMLMDIQNVEYDTLTYAVLFQMPLDTSYYQMRQGVRFEPVMMLRCNAVKRPNVTGLGQAWTMLDPLGRPLEYLLLRGYKTVRIVQTGQK